MTPSLTTTPISGRMIVPRRIRLGGANPEARAERTEIAAMRVSFIVGRRWRCLFLGKRWICKSEEQDQ